MKQPFFSIIIPTYNRASFIGNALNSLLTQSFQDFEIIVVDDGSVDETQSVVSECNNDKIKYYKIENVERGGARNYGAKKAEGVFINFIDSDDQVYPHHLEVAHALCNNNQGITIFHLAYDVKDENLKTLKTVSNLRNINKNIVKGNVLSCNGVFIKRADFLNNPFKEDRELSSLEDWELWIRMSSRYTFFNSNVVTSTILHHNSRSVLHPDIERIEKKAHSFIRHVSQDAINKRYYGDELKKAIASVNTYTSLHILMANGSRRDALKYLMRGINHNIMEIFRVRFLVILKMMLRIKF